MLKVGRTITPEKRGEGTECPKCKRRVFKKYKKGFVTEYILITKDLGKGKFEGKAHKHCPSCGYWDFSETVTVSEPEPKASEKPKKKTTNEE